MNYATLHRPCRLMYRLKASALFAHCFGSNSSKSKNCMIRSPMYSGKSSSNLGTPSPIIWKWGSLDCSMHEIMKFGLFFGSALPVEDKMEDKVGVPSRRKWTQRHGGHTKKVLRTPNSELLWEQGWRKKCDQFQAVSFGKSGMEKQSPFSG